MNKYEFLAQLRNLLSSVPQEEREAAMSYYEEFFSDAGEENEQAVIASLGSPEELAESIINAGAKEEPQQSSAAKAPKTDGFVAPPTEAQSQRGKWSGGQIALIVVLLVLSSPVWLGLLSALAGIVIAILCTLLGIIVAMGACAAAFFAGGVTSLVVDPALGLLFLGTSLVFIGLFPLAIFPLCKLVVKLIIACVKGIIGLIGKLTGRKGVSAQ